MSTLESQGNARENCLTFPIFSERNTGRKSFTRQFNDIFDAGFRFTRKYLRKLHSVSPFSERNAGRTSLTIQFNHIFDADLRESQGSARENCLACPPFFRAECRKKLVDETVHSHFRCRLLDSQGNTRENCRAFPLFQSGMQEENH